jgi:hypothetical protein
VTGLNASDERIHPAGEGALWNDSLYFNCYDPEQQIGVVTRIGILPNQGQANVLLFAVKGGDVGGLHVRLEPRPDGDWDDLTVGGVRYRVVEPFETCKITAETPDLRADLEVASFTPAVAYHDVHGNVTDAYGVATGHYEQSCRVRGWIELGADRHNLDALGQRDHSWGIRDWSGVDWWFWVSPMFGEDLSLNIFKAKGGGTTSAGGMLWKEGRAAPIVSAEVDVDVDSEGRQTSARVNGKDSEGRTVELAGERIAIVSLPVGSSVVDEAFFRFSMNDRIGYGVFEYLHSQAAFED